MVASHIPRHLTLFEGFLRLVEPMVAEVEIESMVKSDIESICGYKSRWTMHWGRHRLWYRSSLPGLSKVHCYVWGYHLQQLCLLRPSQQKAFVQTILQYYLESVAEEYPS